MNKFGEGMRMRKLRSECVSLVAAVAARQPAAPVDRIENIGAEPKLAPITHPSEHKVSAAHAAAADHCR